MAFIRKRIGKNGITYHLYDKDPDGNQVAEKVPVDNIRDAREYLKQYLWERANHKPTSLIVKEMRFSRLVEEYLVYSKHRKTEYSYRKEMSVVNLLLAELGSLVLLDITKQRIEGLQNKWKDAGKANKTINNRTILLGTMLNYALDNGYIPYAPKVKKFKVDKKRPIIYTDDEVALIFSNSSGLMRDYLVVFYYTGCRLSEIKNLKWEEIDLQKRLLNIERSKSHKYRVIPINDALYDHLLKLKSKKTRHQVYLFEMSEGQPLSDYYHRFKKFLIEQKVVGSIHQFRRTFTSKLVEQQVPIEVAQELLGHSSIEVTKSHYTRISENRLRQAVNQLAI